MSINDHIKTAEALWHQGDKTVALTLALVATDATARLRYPEIGRNGDRFRAFIRDISHAIISGRLDGPPDVRVRFVDERGNGRPRELEDMLYEELRNNLIHEAQLRHLQLSPSHLVESELRAQMHVPPTGSARIPDFWVLNLLKALKAAPENRSDASEA